MTYWNVAKFAFAFGVVCAVGSAFHGYVDMLLGIVHATGH